MILWHLGCGLLVSRWLYGRGLDFRWTTVGLLLPDLIDKPVGRIVMPQRFQSGRLMGHALVTTAAVLTVAHRVGSREGRRERGARIGNAHSSVAAGLTVHLILDGIWNDEKVALWPFSGSFPRKPLRGAWWRAFLPGVADRKLIEEMLGVIALEWLRRHSVLADPGGLSRAIRTGKLFE